MTKRERVMAAVRGEHVDHVPAASASWRRYAASTWTTCP